MTETLRAVGTPGLGPGLTGGGGPVGGHGQQSHQWQQFDVHAGAAAGAFLPLSLSLSLFLSFSGTIQGRRWPQAGFLAELRLQPGTAERESHFLRREGGWGVPA